MSIESEFITKVADDYRARGYRVEVGQPLPSEFGLPPGQRADLVAHSPDETVVVEAKKRSAVGSDHQVRALAAAIAGRPGWRLELLLIPDEEPNAPVATRPEESRDVALAQLLRAA